MEDEDSPSLKDFYPWVPRLSRIIFPRLLIYFSKGFFYENPEILLVLNNVLLDYVVHLSFRRKNWIIFRFVKLLRSYFIICAKILITFEFNNYWDFELQTFRDNQWLNSLKQSKNTQNCSITLIKIMFIIFYNHYFVPKFQKLKNQVLKLRFQI
jgi:hypothetical protein